MMQRMNTSRIKDEPKGRDRRNYQRMALPIAAYLQSPWTPPCLCEVVNLSLDGVLLRPTGELPGVDARVAFLVPGCGVQSLSARVVDRSREGGRAIALSFVEMPTEFEHALRESLADPENDRSRPELAA